MKIVHIAALTLDNAIGQDGKLPWHIPEDLKRFKALTKGHVILMGRKTHESIGRTLPDRLNVVLSRDVNYKPSPGTLRASSLEEALEIARHAIKVATNKMSRQHIGYDEVWVIGGGEIYRQTLELAEELHLTRLPFCRQEADTHYPRIDQLEFTLRSEERFGSNYGDCLYRHYARQRGA